MEPGSCAFLRLGKVRPGFWASVIKMRVLSSSQNHTGELQKHRKRARLLGSFKKKKKNHKCNHLIKLHSFLPISQNTASTARIHSHSSLFSTLGTAFDQTEKRRPTVLFCPGSERSDTGGMLLEDCLAAQSCIMGLNLELK